MSLTRRLFLRNTAAAGAVLTTVAAPVIAEAAQQEHPELLAAAGRLPALMAEYTAAVGALEAARAEYGRLAPPLPDDLVVPTPVGRGLGRDETDLDGKVIWPPEVGRVVKLPRRIYASDLIAHFHQRDFRKRDPHARGMKRLHDIALRYEEACQAARDSAGVDAAFERRNLAEMALRRLAWDVAQIVPASLTGLVIKARCVEAYAECGEEARVWAAGPAQRLPADILAVFGSVSS